MENTHEPLVSREDFKQVQSLIKSHPSPSTFEVVNIFRGILYCSECGHHLSTAHKRSETTYYRCVHHYRHPVECLYTHAVHYEDLYQTVLGRVRKLATLMRDDDSLIELVRQKGCLTTAIMKQ